MKNHDIELPPLPKGDIAADTCPVMWVHTDQQIESYAREAIKADRKRRGEPVNLCDCERSHNGLGTSGRECDCPAGKPPRLDEPVRVPSDEAIERLASEHLNAHAQFVGAGEVHYEGEIEFARALLARYGQPVEPP